MHNKNRTVFKKIVIVDNLGLGEQLYRYPARIVAKRCRNYCVDAVSCILMLDIGKLAPYRDAVALFTKRLKRLRSLGYLVSEI